MKVAATPAALALLEQLRAAEPSTTFVLVLGSGCCEGTAPHLFRDYVLVPEQERVGDIAGIVMYADAHVRRLYAGRELTIDARQDPTADGFSAEIPLGWRLVLA